jgi:hypothetical protein
MRAAAGGVCSCSGRAGGGGCRGGCALRFVAERLRDAGYNSAICRSKWSRTLDIPSGNARFSDYCFFFPFQVQLQSKVGCLIYNPTKCRISKMSNKKALLVLRSTHQFHARQKPFFFSSLGR